MRLKSSIYLFYLKKKKNNKKKKDLWKFPGGLSDLKEKIPEVAVRETFEETGIQAEFISILGFRESVKVK